MASLIGERLSHFRVTARIGAGGMGEVYRAEDTKLGREVAIKLLPPEVGEDTDRLARFEREARVLATLNHPNIAAIYQLEEEGDRQFLVMELVEGRTLDRVVPTGGMNLETFFAYAIPLVDGVAAAHEKGVTHRDLKPENVLVDRNGRVKILDFGIAKLRDDLDETGLGRTTERLTAEGQVVGTVAYMSPEQIKGEPLDHRSDLFSLGVVLYQMAVGRHPFASESSPEILASILKDEPATVAEVRSELPAQLGRIIAHCLEKNPRRRFQSALDLQNALRDLRQQVALGEASASIVPASKAPVVETRVEESRRVSRREGVIAIVLIALFAVLFVWRRVGERPEEMPADGTRTGSETAPVTRHLMQLTSGAELEEWPAWSPDGQQIVYAAEQGGLKRLFLRSLADDTTRRIDQTEYEQIQPAWSPSGGAIAFVRARSPGIGLVRSDVRGWFFSGGDVWTLELATGASQLLIEDAFNPAFAPDGARIAVDAEWAGPRRIWTTDARGRNPKQLTTDVSEAVTHTAPSWSPDGSRVVYRRIQQTLSDIYVTDISTDRTFPVTDDEYLDLDPVWSPDGAFIYFSSYRGGGLNIWRIPVTGEGRPEGGAEQMTTGAGDDLQLTVSPDGQRLAFAVLRLNSDLWRLPVDPETGAVRGEAEPLVATTREDSRGAWSSDGRRLAFNSDRSGSMNLWLLEVSTDETTQLTRGPGGDYQPRFSPDDRALVFFSARSGNNDIWSLTLDSGELTQLTRHPGLDINPFVSPDGKTIAYMSDGDGRLEIWLMGRDGSDQRVLTSVGASGHFILWSDDSRAMTFRSGTGSDAKIYRVAVDDGAKTELRPIASGAHMSFAANRNLILDVSGHRTLLVYSLAGGEPQRIFEFEQAGIHVDYPVWSPDGGSIVFDRAVPQGGDIWLLEGLH